MTSSRRTSYIRLKLYFSVAVMLFFVLAGCMTVGPDYVPPDPSLPKVWHNQPKGIGVEGLDKQRLAGWWTTLNDPVLTKLIEQALAGNFDLKEARARVQEARARHGISSTELFPTIDATGSARLSRSSEATGKGDETKLYATGVDATWELDLFGGKRRGIEATEAELQASEEDLRDVLVSLLAEVALNYVEVRSFQTRLSITKENLNIQNDTYNITQWRFQAGLTTQLDVEQAAYILEQTRSQIPGLQTGLGQAKNRLSVLLGQHPGSVEEALDEHKSIPITPLEVAIGVPADILRQRPDIRRAERRLAAQTAKIGVATADLYPKFSLLGSIGLQAPSSTDLFLVTSRTHSIGPSLSWRIFDANAIRNNIAVQNALQQQALSQYEATVLKALEEAENALLAYTQEHRRRQSLLGASQAAQRAVDLAHAQYSSGLIDFVTVMEAQRSLLSLKDQLTVSAGEVASNLIALYKALGGGWTSLAPDENK